MLKIITKKKYIELLSNRDLLTSALNDLDIAQSRAIDYENQQEEIVSQLKEIINELKQSTSKKKIIGKIKKLLKDMGVNKL